MLVIGACAARARILEAPRPGQAILISLPQGIAERHQPGPGVIHKSGAAQDASAEHPGDRQHCRHAGCETPSARPGADWLSSSMRKQYYFRESEQGLLAWDVHRLIDLAAHLQPCRVELSALQEIDEPYWYGPRDPSPTCRSIIEHMRLVEAADCSWPIILSPSGCVMDGMHRVGKALLEGRASIAAIRFDVMPAPDYIGVDPAELPYDEVRELAPGSMACSGRTTPHRR